MESGDKVRFFLEEKALDEKGNFKQEVELSVNKIGHALHSLHPVFKEFSTCQEMRQICRDLGFEKPVLPQSMYIFKQPKIGGQVTPHQDSSFIFTEPLSTIGFWFALDHASEENGCLWGVPRSHRNGIPQKYIRTPEISPYATKFVPPEKIDYDLSNAIPLPAEEGTMIILDGSFVHFSAENTSLKPRHAYTLHVIESQNCIYPDSNWLQMSEGGSFEKLY
jgi:phytanoyl-CoA hydroxylase